VPSDVVTVRVVPCARTRLGAAAMKAALPNAKARRESVSDM
jgi:hypothetical protein